MNKPIRVLLSMLLALTVLCPVFGFQKASAQWDGQGATVMEHPEGWQMQKGDWLLVNVESNTLQFVREDDSAISDKIRIGSGKILDEGKKMYYLGMAYDPKTPEKVWEIRSKQQQNWKNVFGSKEAKEQLFLRLYEVKGDQRIWTHYGIHTTPEIEAIFKNDEGFGSWGCILARYDLLKTIEKLYGMNDNVVRVVTTRRQAEDVLALKSL